MTLDRATVDAAFISSNAASYIASTYTATIKGTKPPALTLDPACLRNLNAFLDYFLAIIIKEAKSTELQDLKATLARILDSALGYVALNEAQAELETYRNQETGAGRKFEYDRPKTNSAGSESNFNVEEVWLQARIRCMIYSTVGEKEESDFPVLPNDEASVTPPVAIFLTAVLEFLGEHILLTSARFARDRLGSGSKGVLSEEDLDRGVRMDKVLGTIWQGYLTIMPNRNEASKRVSLDTLDSNGNGRTFSALPFTTNTHSSPKNFSQNSDQYEQRSNTDPTMTPVILRKLSPGLTNGRSALNNETPPRYDPSQLHRDDPFQNRADENEYLETIKETTTMSSIEPPSVAPLQITRDFVRNGGRSSPDSFYETRPESDSAGMENVDSFAMQDNRAQTTRAASETNQQDQSDAMARPGLWNARPRSIDASGEIQRASLWRRTSSSRSMTQDRSTLATASNTSLAPALQRGTYESGVFQWNAGKQQGLSRANMRTNDPKNDTSNSTLSPFRELYEHTYANQSNLDTPAKSRAPTQNQSQPSYQTPEKNLGNSLDNFAASSRNIEEPKFSPYSTPRSDMSSSSANGPTTIKSTSVPISISTNDQQPGLTYIPPRNLGLGLRDASNKAIDTDYESFMHTGFDRDVQAPNSSVQTTNADARRARIIAAREQAVKAESPQSPLKETFGKAAPGSGTLSSKIRSPVGSPRDATTQGDTTETLRLAEFIRSTGPASYLPTNGTEHNNAREKNPKPFKTTKAESRMPLESENETDSIFDDTNSANGTARGNQTLSEFLRTTAPPSANIQEPQVYGLRTTQPRLAPLHIQGGSNDDDTLIAGPAYSGPSTVTPTTPTVGNGSPPRSASLSSSQLRARSILGASVTSPDVQKVTSPRAVTGLDIPSENEEGADDDDDDDDSIYGNPRRKPVVKESLAEFLRNSGPSPETSPRLGSSPGGRSASAPKTRSKIGKRLSSLSILVGGRSPKHQSQDESMARSTLSATTSPSRPNHRPLMQ